MKLKPRNRIATLAAAVSAVSASSLLLSRGIGETARHVFLITVAIACSALLIYTLVVWRSDRNSIR